jgi:hypothetical protein
MSMANAMAASDGVRERGICPIGARLWGAGPGPQCSPLGGTLATIAPLTFHSMDDSLSHAACGAVSLAQMGLGVSRAHPAPARGVQGRLQGGFTSAAPSRS